MYIKIKNIFSQQFVAGRSASNLFPSKARIFYKKKSAQHNLFFHHLHDYLYCSMPWWVVASHINVTISLKMYSTANSCYTSIKKILVIIQIINTYRILFLIFRSQQWRNWGPANHAWREAHGNLMSLVIGLCFNFLIQQYIRCPFLTFFIFSGGSNFFVTPLDPGEYVFVLKRSILFLRLCTW